MKVYLAARFYRQVEIKQKALELEALGITVTARWLDEKSPTVNGTLSGLTEEYMRDHANIDVEDICECDVLVLFTEDPTEPHVRGGRHFEAGLAYGFKKTLITVGPRENIFHYLEDTLNFPTWEDAKQSLKLIKSFYKGY